jgi:hypothetical protein
MNYKAWLKPLSAIILAICLFLPMSQCKYEKIDAVDNKGVVTTSTTHWEDLTPIPIKRMDGYDYTTVIVVLLFVWPLLFEIFSYKYPTLNKSYLFLISKLILLFVTAYMATKLIFFGDRVAYGAYVFGVSAITYASTTIIDLKRRISLGKQSR